MLNVPLAEQCGDVDRPRLPRSTVSILFREAKDRQGCIAGRVSLPLVHGGTCAVPSALPQRTSGPVECVCGGEEGGEDFWELIAQRHPKLP